MTVARITLAETDSAIVETDAVLLAARPGSDRSGSGRVELIGDIRLDGIESAELADHLAVVGFAAARDELVRLPRGSSGSVAVIGLGSDITPDALRSGVGSAIRQLAGTSGVSIGIPAADDAQLRAIMEGAALGSYSYTGLRSATLDAARPAVAAICVRTDAASATSILTRSTALAQAVALTKDLVNAPPSELYPQALADAATSASAGLPIEVTVWDQEQLEHDGFGGIAGVGRGSVRPPRLVKLSYRPTGSRHHIALVGKGITFDSGGISLKPPVSMVGMKYDMAGAAAVLAAITAVARLELPVRMTAWLCIAENMPSGSAIKPNDVLRIRGGRTVEVLNTDAEGRLVMADGLAAASEERPDAIVDVATLTGAAVVALGHRYAAVMGEDALVKRVLDAASSAGELLWPMPLPSELRATLSSEVADIANATPGSGAGGMLLAGVFLQEFVGRVDEGADSSRIPWAHLDIAGPAQLKGSPYAFVGKGATGVAVRTLIRLAEDFCAE
jgi:leucyl aminopeptidase